MVEIKIQLKEDIVRQFGYDKIEAHLHESVEKMLLKAAAKDILEDIDYADLENDAKWQTARESAWQQERHKYVTEK